MSAGFPEQFLNDIRSRITVSSVVSRRVKLIRRGIEFVGLSPFSSEKTPSFTVNDEKAFYHCFSTQEHGDIFTFLMKTQQLTFPEAVELLAEEAGLEVPQRTAAEVQKAAKVAALQPVVEGACALYEEALWSAEGRKPLEYLHGRGLSDETIRRFRLGYAPSGNYLKERLTARGTAEYMLLDARLVSPGKDGRESFDFFRDRVMFPIMDHRGRVVAFGGRSMGDAEPKYLNSADTPLFHKGSLLYGLSLARESASAKRDIIAVEGYMDVIAMAQAGYENTVAPLGTALTESQLSLLWRYAAEPVLCFDGDKAGIAAAKRASDRALPLLKPGYSLHIVTLPAGLDPDDVCQGKGPEEMPALLASACPLSVFVWDQLVAENPINTPERRAGFSSVAAAKAKSIQDETVQKQYRQFFRDQATKQFPGEVVEREEPRALADAPSHHPPHDTYHDGLTPDDILGEHCLITALGHSMRGDGRGVGKINTYHFLDIKGQVRSLSAGAMRTPTNITDLFFGDQSWLEEMAPHKTVEGTALPGDKATWKVTQIVPLLMRACDAAGFFDPENSVRGPGVWPYGVVKEWPRRDPRVVVHTGGEVWVVDTSKRPAEFKHHRGGVRVGDFVYARTRSEDRLSPLTLDDGGAANLIRFYGSWNWEEKAQVLGDSLVGFLQFGWLAAAGLPALLPVRPHLFVRGPTTAGKSAVVSHHEALLGSTAVRMENATMTGIRNEFLEPQPVRALLCNESNERNNPQSQEQLRQVLDVALYCYTSGEGRQLRGPGGISGSLNAIFMFAAVRPPILNSDDANRMLLLNIQLLPALDAQQLADYRAWREDLKPLGPQLRRRMLERWGDYPAVFAIFEAALLKLQYQTREADTFGTLMTCAWLGSRQGLPTDTQAYEVASAVSTSMFAQAADESEPEWKQCWTHLATTTVDWFNDRRITVGELIEAAIKGNDVVMARNDLKSHGLAVVRRVGKVEKAASDADGQAAPSPREWVAVSYGHRGLEEIFRTSRWKDGKWNAALAQMPGAEKNHPANFAGQKRGKATLIPIAVVKRQEGDEVFADDPNEELRIKETGEVK